MVLGEQHDLTASLTDGARGEFQRRALPGVAHKTDPRIPFLERGYITQVRIEYHHDVEWRRVALSCQRVKTRRQMAGTADAHHRDAYGFAFDGRAPSR